MNHHPAPERSVVVLDQIQHRKIIAPAMTATGFKDETIHLKSTKLQEKRQEKQ